MQSSILNTTNLPTPAPAPRNPEPVEKFTLPKSTIFRLSGAVDELIARPSEETKQALHNALENSGYEIARDRRAAALDELEDRLVSAHQKIEDDAVRLVEQARTAVPKEELAALTIHLQHRFWGPLGDRNRVDATEGVRAEHLAECKKIFDEYSDLRGRMMAVKYGFRLIQHARENGGILDKLPWDHSPGMKRESQEPYREPFTELLAQSEKEDFIRAAIERAAQQPPEQHQLDLVDVLQYILPEETERKSVLTRIVSEPSTASHIAAMEERFRGNVNAVQRFVLSEREELKDNPKLRLDLWLNLTAASDPYARLVWGRDHGVAETDAEAFGRIKTKYSELKRRADLDSSQLHGIHYILMHGNPYIPNEKTAYANDLAALWAEKKVLAEFLTQAEKVKLLKPKIESLLQDNSYQGAEELESLLALMAPTKEQRRDLAETMDDEWIWKLRRSELEERARTLSGQAESYSRYIEQVGERLDRFASVVGGRESWGFAHGVDVEDLIDERNAGREIGDRNRAANAAIKRLKALDELFES